MARRRTPSPPLVLITAGTILGCAAGHALAMSGVPIGIAVDMILWSTR